MTYGEAEAFLMGLPRFTEVGAAAYRPGIERTRVLLEAMGEPQEAWDSVHIAGTNGKGSTASMVASVSSALGKRTGLHTSPHLIRLGERMRVDGVPAADDWIAGAVQRYSAVMSRVGASFFEATTALTFLFFAESDIEIAVVEVGMGGRFDATNVLRPRTSAITHVDLDHTEFLGSTLAEIAREKAGIIKPRTPIVLAPSPPDVVQTVAATASELEAPLHLVEEDIHLLNLRTELDRGEISARTPRGTYKALRIGAGGRHQVENALVALRVAEVTWPEETALTGAVFSAFARFRELTGLRGRMEILGRKPLVVADVAHNADGIGRVVDAILNDLRRGPGGRLHVVLGLMADKDASAIAVCLAAADAIAYCVEIDASRALPAVELAQILTRKEVDIGGVGRLRGVFRQALAAATGCDAVLVTGSHLVVGEMLTSP